MLNEAIDIERGIGVSTSFGRTKMFSMNVGGNDAQRNFAVDAAEGEIVDLVAERRNVGAFGGIDIDGEHIFSVEIEMRGQVEGERSVAAFVFAELGAVDPDSGGGHHAFKVDEDMFASGLRGQLEMAAVNRDELVSLLVEAVPRQLERWYAESRRDRSRSRRNSCHARLHYIASCSANCDSWETQGWPVLEVFDCALVSATSVRCERGTAENRACVLQEFASIQFFLSLHGISFSRTRRLTADDLSKLESWLCGPFQQLCEAGRRG